MLPVFKTSLALEKILLPSSKTTESGVVCFFVVWRSVVMTTAFKIEVAQRFFFSQLATLVIYYNFLKLATFQLGVAQGVIILTRRCLSFISSSVTEPLCCQACLLNTKLLDVDISDQIIYRHYIYQTLNFFPKLR